VHTDFKKLEGTLVISKEYVIRLQHNKAAYGALL